MTQAEAQLACPVCLSTAINRAMVEGPQPFLIDHCDNCGGTWFDAGEVMQLRQCKPQVALQVMSNVEGLFEHQCHSCGALMDRNDDRCPACGKPNELQCPRCRIAMTRKPSGPLVLDVCTKCQGVWFDRHELRQLWQLAFKAVAKDAARDPLLAFYGADVATGFTVESEIAPGVKLNDVASTTVATILKTVSTAFE